MNEGNDLDYGKLDTMLTDLQADGYQSVPVYDRNYKLRDIQDALHTFGELSLDDERLTEIPDRRQEDSLKAVELRHDLAPYLDMLTDRQRLVVSLRFGLNDEPEHTESEIGDILGVSRQRAQQILSGALSTLREYMTMDEY
jgi:RNA polymerase sigma factor (sigma-70 family)